MGGESGGGRGRKEWEEEGKEVGEKGGNKRDREEEEKGVEMVNRAN